MDTKPKIDAVLTGGDTTTPEMDTQIAEIRAAASVLIERIAYMRQHGITFNGMRDLYEIFGYDRQLTPSQYRERYRRGGIAGRIVDVGPNACWRGGIEVIEDEDPKNKTEFEKAVDLLDKKVKLWSTLWRADKLAQQAEYAVILLGVKDGRGFDQELKKGRPDQVLYLTPFSQEDAIVQEWDTDHQSERFGLPTKYQLRRYADSLERTIVTQAGRAPAFVSPELNKPIHWTRVIHIPAEGFLDNEIFGLPALERVWNLLDDLEKVTGGGAEAFWIRANQGIHLNVDKDMDLKKEEKDALATQADEYQHQMRRMLRTRGVDVEVLGSDVANFSNPADAILTQVAGSKAIPKRILTGSEMGELASSQDRDNWKDQVDGRQTQYCGPYLVRQLFDRLVAYNYLPTPKEYNVKWAHVQTLTETEKAEGAGKWATVNQQQGSPVFLSKEIRDKWYGMPPLTDADIKAEADTKQLMVPPQLQQPQNTPGAPGTPQDNQNKDENQNKPPAKPQRPPLPFQRRAAEGAEETLSTEDIVVATELETAIRNKDTETLDRLLGLHRNTQEVQDVVTPNIEIIHPPQRSVKKTLKYSMVEGVMRPTEIVEEPM